MPPSHPHLPNNQRYMMAIGMAINAASMQAPNRPKKGYIATKTVVAGSMLPVLFLAAKPKKVPRLLPESTEGFLPGQRAEGTTRAVSAKK